MKVATVLAASALAVASAQQECPTSTLFGIIAGPNGAACTSTANYSPASLSLPTGAQLTTLCSTDSCKALLQEISAAVPTECLFNGKPFKATILDKLPDECEKALGTASGSNNSTSASNNSTSVSNNSTAASNNSTSTNSTTSAPSNATATPVPTPEPTTETPPTTTEAPTASNSTGSNNSTASNSTGDTVTKEPSGSGSVPAPSPNGGASLLSALAGVVVAAVVTAML